MLLKSRFEDELLLFGCSWSSSKSSQSLWRTFLTSLFRMISSWLHMRSSSGIHFSCNCGDFWCVSSCSSPSWNPKLIMLFSLVLLFNPVDPVAGCALPFLDVALVDVFWKPRVRRRWPSGICGSKVIRFGCCVSEELDPAIKFMFSCRWLNVSAIDVEIDWIHWGMNFWAILLTLARPSFDELLAASTLYLF